MWSVQDELEMVQVDVIDLNGDARAGVVGVHNLWKRKQVNICRRRKINKLAETQPDRALSSCSRTR